MLSNRILLIGIKKLKLNISEISIKKLQKTIIIRPFFSSRIKRLYFGCNDEKSGAVNSGAKIFNQKNCNHKPEIYDGIRASECSLLIKNFFNEVRRKI